MDDKKNIIFFMPFIGGGGVEKNLFQFLTILLENQIKFLFAHHLKNIDINFIKKLN